METTFQWGFIGEGECPSCCRIAELWVTSSRFEGYGTAHVPQCVYCHNSEQRSLLRLIDHDSELRTRYEALIEANPLKNPDTYGVIKPSCIGCGHIIYDDSETVEALDYFGKVFTVHALCSRSSCSECENLYVVANARYMYYRVRQELTGENFGSVDYTDTFDGDNICMPCADRNDYVSCEHCGRYGDADSTSRYDGCDYCERCYEDNVHWCTDCDDSYWGDNHDDCENGPIKSWDYKPEPEFFGHNGATYYLGLELEVENSHDQYGTEETARYIQESYLGARAYIKHDGSISDGFEIVTHPHTLSAIENDFNWSVLDRLSSRGFRSWDAQDSSCGIHVHISRTAFGQDSQRRRVSNHKSDAHLLRFMKLIYDNQRQVERLAGRSSQRWADFGDKGRLVNKVKNGQQSNGRYSAVNTENWNTIEVRVFKGSLNKQRVLSALEFVTAVTEYTRDLKVTGTNRALDWSRFVSYVVAHDREYPNLLAKIDSSLSAELIND